jgi:hypothetical protein
MPAVRELHDRQAAARTAQRLIGAVLSGSAALAGFPRRLLACIGGVLMSTAHSGVHTHHGPVDPAVSGDGDDASSDGESDAKQEEREIKLGTWIGNQCSRAATPTPERIERLSRIGMRLS